MTLSDAMLLCEREGGTGLTDAEKAALLSGLDGRIHDSVLSHYDGATEFTPYEVSSEAAGAVLLVPAPYDEIYPVYLMSVSALLSGAVERYGVYSAIYNNLYSAFAVHYSDTHSHKTVRVKGV